MEKTAKENSLQVRLCSVHMKALELIAEANGATVEEKASDLLSSAIEQHLKLRLDEIFEDLNRELEEQGG